MHQLALAGDDRDLAVAGCRRRSIVTARPLTRPISSFSSRLAEPVLGHAEVLGDALGDDADLRACLLARRLTTSRATLRQTLRDLALEATDAGFLACSGG